jgi:transposase
MKSYVGMDVHSKSSVFVIQNEHGEEMGRGEVPTSVEGFRLLRRRYGLRASTLVGLESGTMAFFAARRLGELGLSPVVVDAREVRMKAHRPRQKSDTRDAVELCEGVGGQWELPERRDGGLRSSNRPFPFRSPG